MIRKLYDWVLTLAEKPGAAIMLFFLAFAESSFFPVPPDILLIPLVLGSRKKWFPLALTVTLGSTLGGIAGYFIGYKLWWANETVHLILPDLINFTWMSVGEVKSFSDLADFFFRIIPGFSTDLFWNMKEKYDLYNFMIVFTAGFTPVPYKIITISAGAFNVDFNMFMIASVVSRGARFFIVAFLIYMFGEPVKSFIDKYFNWLALIFTVLLITGFVLLKGII